MTSILFILLSVAIYTLAGAWALYHAIKFYKEQRYYACCVEIMITVIAVIGLEHIWW